MLATQMGKGVVAEGHARSLRSLGIHRPDHAHMALDRADLVVALGYQPNEHPPLAWQQDRNLPVVHVNDSSAKREAGYQPEFEVIGRLESSIDQLADAGLGVATDWTDELRNEIVARLEAEEGPEDCVDPLDVVRVAADLHQPGDVVALDNGVYRIWFARHFPSPDPHALILDNATASMGAGLATATAAARLGRRSLAVVGDGGLLMNVRIWCPSPRHSAGPAPGWHRSTSSGRRWRGGDRDRASCSSTVRSTIASTTPCRRIAP